MTTFEEATEAIRVQFGKRRIANFAKKNNVTNEEVEVVDEVPISDLAAAFKKAANPPIRVRIFKNLSEEQQKAWIEYYTANAKLALRVKSGNNSATDESSHKAKRALELSNETEAVVTPTKRTRKDVTSSSTVPAPIGETKRKHKTANPEELEEKVEKVEKKPRKNKKEVKQLTDNEIVEHIIKSSAPPESSEKKTHKRRKHSKSNE